MIPGPLSAAIRARFPDARFDPAEQTVLWNVPPQHLIPACEFARDHELARFDLLLAIAVIDGHAHYLLRSVQGQKCLTLRVPLNRSPALDSAAFVWPAANWLERQACDLWDVQFRRHPDLRPLFGHNAEAPWVDPEYLASGSLYPTSLDGLFLQRHRTGAGIESAEPVLGYCRCGLENALARWPYERGPLLAARLDAFAAMHADLAYAIAVERLLHIEPPPKAQGLRVVLAELQRINSHLFWAARAMQRLGDPAFAAPAYAALARSAIGDLFQWLGGNPVTPDAIAIGGLRPDLPDNIASQVQAMIPGLTQGVQDLCALVGDSEPIHSRLQGMGVIDPGTALGLGLTGPALRACGNPYDVRRAFPYAGYGQLAVRVPSRRQGDALARLEVRLAEIECSLELIQTVLSSLSEDGPTNALVSSGGPNRIPLPGLPAGLVCASVESPRGELDLLIVSDGSPSPRAVYVRGPSLANLSALPFLTRHSSPEQVALILDSLDVSIAEAER